MDNLALAQLAERLLRAGVAPRYVRRGVEELRAHRADLLAQFAADGLTAEEAEGAALARLGSIDAYYDATIARPELQSWPRRRPGLTFGLLPVLAFIALVAGCIALTIGLASLAEPIYKARGVVPAGLRATGELLRVLILWGVPLAVAALCAVIAVRWRLRSWWPAFGVLLVAVLGAGTTMQLTWATSGGHGSLQAGYGFPGAFIRTLVVIAVVLLPYMAWSYRRSRARDQRADE
ncbi:MAG TPA: hypothetical protein VGO41_05915 [Steroidobacteraceae bacterium]|jgi:hypothetical protein|nr:hypothetical protein [Steroidobacteraceae bacterium]